MSNIKQYFNKFNLKINGKFLGFGTSPEADWKIIFVSDIALSVLAIILSVYMFIKIDKGEIFVVGKSAGQEGETLDIDILKETVSYYQDKAIEFERVKKMTVSSVDPSI